MEKDFDVLVVGDAMLDILTNIHEAKVHCPMKGEDCEVCFRYGAKIQLDSLDMFPGGIACNIAVGLSRLGNKTTFIAELGDDIFAQKILQTLETEGVNHSFLTQTKDAVSSITIAINVKGERTLLEKHATRVHNFNFDVARTSWVYLAGTGNSWKQAYKNTHDYVAKHQVKLAFTPGSLQLKEGYESFADILHMTTVLIVNKEEALQMVSAHDRKETIEELLRNVQKLGPKIVVITDGKNGAYAISDTQEVFFKEIIPVSIVEKTGAGDAFASGFLRAIIAEEDIPQALVWGTINSASVIQHVGAQKGLLTLKEMKQKLQK